MISKACKNLYSANIFVGHYQTSLPLWSGCRHILGDMSLNAPYSYSQQGCDGDFSRMDTYSYNFYVVFDNRILIFTHDKPLDSNMNVILELTDSDTKFNSMPKKNKAEKMALKHS